MRKLFATLLLEEMKKNDDVFLLLGGVGYGYYKPDGKRIINCEASESSMVDIAVGLALSGKIPFAYAITPHLYRAFESVRIYLSHYSVPVKLIGCGRDNEYGNLGFTHWAGDDKEFYSKFENLVCVWPEKKDIKKLFKEMIATPKPYYVNLRR